MHCHVSPFKSEYNQKILHQITWAWIFDRGEIWMESYVIVISKLNSMIDSLVSLVKSPSDKSRLTLVKISQQCFR